MSPDPRVPDDPEEYAAHLAARSRRRLGHLTRRLGRAAVEETGVADFVDEHPLTSTAVASGVGALAGVLSGGIGRAGSAPSSGLFGMLLSLTARSVLFPTASAPMGPEASTSIPPVGG